MREFSTEEIDAISSCGDPKVIKAVLIELIKTVQNQAREIAQLKQELKQLKDRVAKNSRNSSKPPSTDQSKGKTTNTVGPKNKNQTRPSGGQPGHKGSRLEPKENPDTIIDLPDHHCDACKDNDVSIERRQEISVQVKITAIEYRANIRGCANGCDELNRAGFPEHVRSPVQYSPAIKGMIAYLSQYQLIPFKRLTEMLEDVFGLKGISQGTVANAAKECSRQLVGFMQAVKEQLIKSDIIHNDETGVSVRGKKHWLHTVCTKLLSLFHIHKKRGHEAIDEMDVLPRFKGRSIHDYWRSYLRYKCDHGLCNAHHLRELTFLHEQENQPWALKMKRLLRALKRITDYAKRHGCDQLPAKLLSRCEARYKSIVAEGCIQNPRQISKTPKRGRTKQTKTRNMLERLSQHQPEVLAFIHDFRVPFDNNQAERDIRMNKVRQKISGTFRGETSPQDYCRIRSYISTLRKNDQNVLKALTDAFLGNPWLPTCQGA